MLQGILPLEGDAVFSSGENFGQALPLDRLDPKQEKQSVKEMPASFQ